MFLVNLNAGNTTTLVKEALKEEANAQIMAVVAGLTVIGVSFTCAIILWHQFKRSIKSDGSTGRNAKYDPIYKPCSTIEVFSTGGIYVAGHHPWNSTNQYQYAHVQGTTPFINRIVDTPDHVTHEYSAPTLKNVPATPKLQYVPAIEAYGAETLINITESPFDKGQGLYRLTFDLSDDDEESVNTRK